MSKQLKRPNADIDTYSEILNEKDFAGFDFDDFKNNYKNVVDGMAVMNIASQGEIGNQVKVEFSEMTKKQCNVDFYFKDYHDMNGHREPQYAAKFTKVHDNKPLEILSDKTVLYGEDVVTLDYLTEHKELYSHLSYAVTCGNIIVDKADNFMRNAELYKQHAADYQTAVDYQTAYFDKNGDSANRVVEQNFNAKSRSSEVIRDCMNKAERFDMDCDGSQPDNGFESGC